MKRFGKHMIMTLIATMILSCTGCTAEQAGIETSASESAEVKLNVMYIENMEDLARGNFYVETPDGYASPYWGDVSFDIESYMSSDSSKVAWFNDYDWTAIPTIYEGDHVVYRTNQELSENFYFERFLDIGYSLGIANMEQTQTGRYKIDIDADTKNQIKPTSDAFRLTELGENALIIDAIGGTPLRSSLISECGTITNLKKDNSYICDVYVGTEIQPYEIIADSRVLYSGQVNLVHDYEFIQAEIIEIEIPDYFNSGYYSVNGSGIFRYVKGSHYTEDTDFNILNPASQEAADKLAEASANKMESTEYVDILSPGTYKITFAYDEEINVNLLTEEMTSDNVPAPEAYINTGNDMVIFTKAERGNRILVADITVETGSYPVEISKIYGRGYSIDIQYVEATTTTDETDRTSNVQNTVENSALPVNENSTTTEPATNESSIVQ